MYKEEAMKILKDFHDKSALFSIRTALETLHPELKESEDEKIRKAIIGHIKDLRFYDVYYDVTPDEMIAWLEKQCEQKPTLPKWKYKKDHTPLLRDSIILNKYGCVAKSPSGAIISDAWVLDYDELVKLPKEELEKQSEQKPTDKVEPRFKKGDWIISNNKKSTYQVIEVKRGIYVIRDNVDNHEYHIGIEEAHKSGRLWIIEEAEDGDYLTVNGRPFIYCCYDDYQGNYCCIDSNGEFRTSFDFGFNGKTILPATKEQRDTLERAITNAGYRWDAEKKELTLSLEGDGGLILQTK